MNAFDYDIRRFDFKGYTELTIDAGYCGHDRIVPPAGEEYAFTVPKYKRNVAISISPTGSSVRVWVDGVEVKK